MSSIQRPLTINQQSLPDFTRPLELLVHCHERIEGHLRALERAAEILHCGSESELSAARAAISLAGAHFAVPGVLHTEDEEVSLFPRLRKWGGAAGRDALDAVESLEAQHLVAEQVHAQLDHLIILMPQDVFPEREQIDRFCGLVETLTAIYRPHISLENEVVFPAAARTLPALEIQFMGDEMRERRQRNWANRAARNANVVARADGNESRL